MYGFEGRLPEELYVVGTAEIPVLIFQRPASRAGVVPAGQHPVRTVDYLRILRFERCAECVRPRIEPDPIPRAGSPDGQVGRSSRTTHRDESCVNGCDVSLVDIPPADVVCGAGD